MSVWRCSECGHGDRLVAWAQSNSYGPLGADGQLLCHDAVEDCFVHEDSIQCEVHPGAAVEFKIRGRFHRWRGCDACRRTGTMSGGFYGEGRVCSSCGGYGGSWVKPSARPIGGVGPGSEPGGAAVTPRGSAPVKQDHGASRSVSVRLGVAGAAQ